MFSQLVLRKITVLERFKKKTLPKSSYKDRIYGHTEITVNGRRLSVSNERRGDWWNPQASNSSLVVT